jgi:hypothetical protein
MLAKLVPTFVDKGCSVVSAMDSNDRHGMKEKNSCYELEV